MEPLHFGLEDRLPGHHGRLVVLHYSARKRQQGRSQRATLFRNQNSEVGDTRNGESGQSKRGDRNLLERGEAVDGEGVGLDGAAVEQDLADVEAGGGDLGGEDELRRGGDHVHVVPRGDEVPHDLRKGKRTRPRGGRKRNNHARQAQSAGGAGREENRSGGGSGTSRARVAWPKPWPVM